MDEPDGETGEWANFDVRPLGHNALEQANSLFNGEERRLLRVDSDAHHQPVENPASAANDVQVAKVHRVEGTRVNRDSLGWGFGHAHSSHAGGLERSPINRSISAVLL